MPKATSASAICALALVTTAAWGQVNVARDRPYQCNVEVLSGWTGLVDGVTDSDAGPGCFATANDPLFPKYVVVNLQRPCMINRIAVHNSENGNTRHITISISADGREYEQLREFIFPNGRPMVLNHRFGDRRAQFVRIGLLDTWTGGLGGDNCIFLREVEVYGSPTGEAGVRAPAAEPTGDALMRTRELRIFRHYAIEAERDLKVLVIGDSMAAGGEGSWPQQLLGLLEVLRPLGTHVDLQIISEPDMDPTSALGDPLDAAIAAEPDLCLLAFGTDIASYSPASLRRDLGELVQRLSVELSGLIVLVGPVPDPDDDESLDAVRGVAKELEQMALFMNLPMLRTERALLDAGVDVWARREDEPAEEAAGQGRELTSDARRVVAERLVELLTQY
ncbi:MAG: hypothetical protein J7M38_09845 [Armatimonadetes bacterium]|nr:hypothetical protein [Armatimonadota bacterium]